MEGFQEVAALLDYKTYNIARNHGGFQGGRNISDSVLIPPVVGLSDLAYEDHEMGSIYGLKDTLYADEIAD